MDMSKIKNSVSKNRKYIFIGIGLIVFLVIFFKVKLIDYFTKTPYEWLSSIVSEKIGSRQ